MVKELSKVTVSMHCHRKVFLKAQSCMTQAKRYRAPHYSARLMHLSPGLGLCGCSGEGTKKCNIHHTCISNVYGVTKRFWAHHGHGCSFLTVLIYLLITDISKFNLSNTCDLNW